ncbi:hydrogenase maturation protein HypF [Mariprofundus aestuarium]|uniref:Carbamoyltransferase HypF n=2 Tax=Mariprofundus aestuarium TaxID=1921086 RepID=A0A2K8KVY4_MARES|nr:hydrogenase maturation protein HypF [Mariprofundus aestuarium]
MSESPLTISINLPESFKTAPQTLALGGELKSSICLIRDGTAHLSRPIGDLEQEDVYRHFSASVESLLADPYCKPEQVVIDKHPDYLSSQYGQKLAAELGLPLLQVQHHYAHIASVMADNGLPLDSKPVLGLALDGLGFGEDGTIWGGEMLLADYQGFQRLSHFKPIAMIGGAAAIHEPWRNTLAQLLPIWDEVNTTFSDTDIVDFLEKKPVATMHAMVTSGLNSPLASSCGRLFDGVAAALGFHREKVAFEAQAAIALEQAASACFEQETSRYDYGISEANSCLQLEWHPMWLALLSDIQKGAETETIAARFHRTLIHALSETAISLCNKHGVNSVALSGGVFQNQLISTHLPLELQRAGLTVLQHRRVPANDAGICLGQATVALAQKARTI